MHKYGRYNNFHDVLPANLEDYGDDLMVKSKMQNRVGSTLKKVCNICQFDKVMNRTNFVGVATEKFVGLLVHHKLHV